MSAPLNIVAVVDLVGPEFTASVNLGGPSTIADVSGLQTALDAKAIKTEVQAGFGYVIGLVEGVGGTVTAEATARAAADAAEATARATAVSAEATARTAADRVLANQTEDAYAAANTDLTRPVFELCTDYGDTYGDHAWTTPSGTDFADGIWIRSVSRILPYNDPGIEDDDSVFSEIFTQTVDDGELVDGIEKAWRRTWSAALGRFVNHLFIETTPIGHTDDDYELTATGWDAPEGVDLETAVWIAFDTDGESRCLLLRRCYLTAPDVTADGADWLIVGEMTGPPTSIQTGNTKPFTIGLDIGRLHVPFVEVRNGGPDGALVVDPTAVAALAEGGTSPFDDGVGNTWSPDTDAVASQPSSDGVALGETSGTAYRGDRGKIGYDYSQSHTGASDPHGDRAHSVQRANHTGSQAASTIGSGTLDIARIPTGSTGSTVPFGNDARFSDTRTPTDGSVTAEKLAAALLERLPTEVVLASPLASTTGVTPVLADATGLAIPVTAGKTYLFEMQLRVTGSSTSDMQVALTFPTGTMIANVRGMSNAASSVPSSVSDLGELTVSGTALTNLGTFAATTTRHIILGRFACTVTGTIQLQFAQRANDATATTILAGSNILYRVTA